MDLARLAYALQPPRKPVVARDLVNGGTAAKRWWDERLPRASWEAVTHNQAMRPKKEPAHFGAGSFVSNPGLSDLLSERQVTGISDARDYVRLAGELFIDGGGPEGDVVPEFLAQFLYSVNT